MLRLDPAHPPLWRTATTLQFGADPVAVVHDPAPWQQRLLHELARGIPDDALEVVAAAFGAPDHEAEVFVRRIRRALAATHAPGDDRLTVQAPSGFPVALADAVVGALTASGFEVALAEWHDAPDERIPDAAPVVVLAEHVLHPRRGASLIAHDVTHVAIVFGGTGAEVGPYVRPGRTACLACVAAHRCDVDPTWPLVASQLIGRPLAEVDIAMGCEAGIVAAHLIREGERHAQRTTSHSLTLRAGSLQRISRAHRPHADCRCRSLEGSEKAVDPADRGPTRATAFARPA